MMETLEFNPEIVAFPKAYNDRPKPPKEFKKGKSALSNDHKTYLALQF